LAGWLITALLTPDPETGSGAGITSDMAKIFRQSFGIAVSAGSTPVLAFRLEMEPEMPKNKTKATTLSVSAYIAIITEVTITKV
jgi:hypothetical protein